MMANTPKRRRGSGSAGLPANGFTEIKDLITQMESFIKEAEALATMEIRRIDAIKESLKASAARLAALFREKDEILSTRERATKEIEDSLAARIRELEKALQEKDALLLAREETLRSLGANTPAGGAPAKAGPTPPPERAPSIREMEQESAERSPSPAGESAGPPASRLVSLLGPIKRRG